MRNSLFIAPTPLEGVYVITRETAADYRGSFARMFCKREMEESGLRADIAQVNLSATLKKGTLRGLHSQSGNDAEDKMVTCMAGEVYDVCVDVRAGSSTFGEWYGIHLTAENGKTLYVPKGFAHGFLSMCDNTAVIYFNTQFYNPAVETGYRYDDPAFNIQWPLPTPFIISEKDNNWPYV